MPGTGGTVSADKAGNSAAEIPTPDPEKRYQISYTGLWSGADYEDAASTISIPASPAAIPLLQFFFIVILLPISAFNQQPFLYKFL